MTPAPDPFEPYLNRAASLFDLGDIVQAGQIWQAILKRDPGHQIARAGLYKVKVCFDARATQEGMVPPVPAPAPAIREPQPEPDHADTAKHPTLSAQAATRAERADLAPGPSSPPTRLEDPEVLLRDGCTLFEMGEVADALLKWERILASEPDHVLARTYANDARRDLGLPALAAGVPPPAREASPVPEAPPPPLVEEPEAQIEIMIREGVQLYDMGMPEEAIAKWQRALELEPGHRNALAYLEMAQRDEAEAEANRRQRASAPPKLPPSVAPPVAITIQTDPLPALIVPPRVPPVVLMKEPAAPPRSASVPRAITTRAAPLRDGPKVPGALGGLPLPAWLNTPRNLGLALGAAALLLTGLFLLREHRREQSLKEAVLTAKAAALKPVDRQVNIEALTQTPDAIRREAESALGDDPLLAYFRAQECLRLDQTDAKAAQLLDQARTRMAAHPLSGTLEALDKLLKAGELEAAETSIRGLLRQTPDDPELRGKARTISLNLAQRYATKERFGDAKDCLGLVRAMYPQETIWPAKLKLLEAIQGLPKADRAGWIPMLG